MILIACVDDNLGMLFNNRRQSMDRVLRARLLKLLICLLLAKKWPRNVMLLTNVWKQ